MRFADCFTPLTPSSAKAIKDAGYDGVCRYLGGKLYPQWGKGLTLIERDVIAAAGLRIVSNWERNPTNAVYFTRALAEQDAHDAFAEARWLGQPLRTPIYFSVDYDAQPADFPRIAGYFAEIHRNIGAHYQVRAYAKGALLEYLHQHCLFLGPGWEPAAWDNGVVEAALALFQDRYGVRLRGGIEVDEDITKSADIGWWTPKGVSMTLQQGASGDAVKTLQEQLNQALGTHIAVDGQYGPATTAAVKSFQVIAHLPVTGNVDSSTELALKARVQATTNQAQTDATKAHDQQIQHALSLLQQAQDIVKSL